MTLAIGAAGIHGFYPKRAYVREWMEREKIEGAGTSN
jgi:hypothetical protein